MKKMMITTALATSLIAGVASADTSVKAYIETTLGSGETPATSAQVNQGTTIGYEHGLAFSGSKDLDNGMTLKTYFDIEDGGAADAIDHEKTGLICDGNELNEVYSSMENLLKEKKHIEYGRNAKINSDNFAWDKVIENYKRIL
mgnify:CR=1 FL=1